MHTLPTLPYNYDALEPYIDEATMKIHHTKHHQAYIDKLNATLEKYPDLQAKPLEELLTNLDAVPEAIRGAVRNHGGGHWNHSFFWQILTAPNSDEAKMPDEIKLLLEKNFESVEKFQTQFKESALARFGSGWTWVVKSINDQLSIITTPNQVVPFTEGKPVLGLDVWEHAYYLKYQNRRADYVDAFFKVVNWGQVLTNSK